MTEQPRKATEKEAMFFLTILQSMNSTPDVDWELVAQRAGYSNGHTAKVRFGQIKNALGASGDAGASASAKPRKKPAAGTKTTPKKIQKRTTTGKKGKKLLTPEADDNAEDSIIKDEDVANTGQDDGEDGFYDAESDNVSQHAQAV